MTSGLLKSCRKKIFSTIKKYLSNPTLDNKFNFTSYRNIFTNVKEAAIIHFFSNKFGLYEKNCRKTWDIINHLMNRKSHHPLQCTFYDTDGQPLTSPIEIANSFNAFSPNIGNEKISPNNLDFKKYLKNSIPQSIFVSTVTSDYWNYFNF